MFKKQKPKDKLFLLMPDFIDPKFPEHRFYCWHCALIEGVLSAFPNLAKQLEIQRVPWPLPRKAVVSSVGEENQSLPLLVLTEGQPSQFQTGTFGKLAFINDKDKILAALAERHGFPEPHP